MNDRPDVTAVEFLAFCLLAGCALAVFVWLAMRAGMVLL